MAQSKQLSNSLGHESQTQVRHVLYFYRMKSCTSIVQSGVFPFLPFTKHRSQHQMRFTEWASTYATPIPFFHNKWATHA